MTTRRISMVAAAAVLALGLSACGSDDGGSEGGEGGSGLKIGIKFDQPGLGLKVGDQYTGLDVDVAKYVAKELGTAEGDITFVQSPSAQRETLISSGQVDLIFATYSITDARKEKISFGGPYFIAGQDLLVRADDTSITGPDTLDEVTLAGLRAGRVVEDDPLAAFEDGRRLGWQGDPGQGVRRGGRLRGLLRPRGRRGGDGPQDGQDQGQGAGPRADGAEVHGRR